MNFIFCCNCGQVTTYNINETCSRCRNKTITKKEDNKNQWLADYIDAMYEIEKIDIDKQIDYEIDYEVALRELDEDN
jgi:hypothetical protein